MKNNIQERFVKMDRENIEAYTPKYAVAYYLTLLIKRYGYLVSIQ